MSKYIPDPKKYYELLPKKPVGAGVLLFNNKNELLIVKPTYKDYWSIPGGVVEKKESPRAGAERETQEEIGLKIKVKRLISIDHLVSKKHGKAADSIQFLFFGGCLNDKQIETIKISIDEIERYQFLKINKSLHLLGKNFKKRLKNSLYALKNKKVIYLENGEYPY